MAATSSIGIRLHMLLLGIIICVVVYMYLVCRDVKRIEMELMTLKANFNVSHLSQIQFNQAFQQLHQDMSTIPSIPKTNLCEIKVNDDDDDDDDQISEDLRDMLTKIEDGEFDGENLVWISDLSPKVTQVTQDPTVTQVTQDPTVTQVTQVTPDGAVDPKVTQVTQDPKHLDLDLTKAPDGMLEADLKLKKIDDLKKLLKDRNMDTGGKKDALIIRLLAHVK